MIPFGDFPSLARMRNEFDQLFDRFFGDLPASWREVGGDWRWGLDVEQTDDKVIVRAEAPGFEPRGTSTWSFAGTSSPFAPPARVNLQRRRAVASGAGRSCIAP